MLLASGHHRIMAAARGALVMMVLGKVQIISSRPRSRSPAACGVEQSQCRLAEEIELGGLVKC